MSLEGKIAETAQQLIKDVEADGRKIVGFAIAFALDDAEVGASFLTGGHPALLLASVDRLSHRLNKEMDETERAGESRDS